MPSKYRNRRTWSGLCQRFFASKAECTRGETLHLLQLAGEIKDLEYQPRYKLCDKPRITYVADFYYLDDHELPVVEDVKGMLTGQARVKIAWAEFRYGMHVRLVT